MEAEWPTYYIGAVNSISGLNRQKNVRHALVWIFGEKVRWYLRFRTRSEFPIIVIEEDNLLSLYRSQ